MGPTSSTQSLDHPCTDGAGVEELGIDEAEVPHALLRQLQRVGQDRLRLVRRDSSVVGAVDRAVRALVVAPTGRLDVAHQAELGVVRRVVDQRREQVTRGSVHCDAAAGRFRAHAGKGHECRDCSQVADALGELGQLGGDPFGFVHHDTVSDVEERPVVHLRVLAERQDSGVELVAHPGGQAHAALQSFELLDGDHDQVERTGRDRIGQEVSVPADDIEAGVAEGRRHAG